MEARRGVGRARPARRHDDARPAGELAPGFGGHRGAALLAADGDRDRAVIERIEEGEIGFAGDAEGALDAVPDERIGKNSPAGARTRSSLDATGGAGRISSVHSSLPPLLADEE